MFAWGSPTAGHFLHVFTCPVHVVALACSQTIPWAGGLFRQSLVQAGGKDPDSDLGGLVPASNAIGVNVYVDHGLRPVPPLIMPHNPPWKPSRNQSAKKLQAKPSSFLVARHQTYLTRPPTNIPTVKLPL
ncbi:hypothetical protein O181_090758 [Austropuccinia psidii MF-1]|uniref:Uncharacterized protein n=1 Tax=Austropuccinia psidii MF-1 TaxID=1389203 RepID=A0A9Q3P6U7_9BASI|nr:hypothetical protein [Austropuccinia psidii MF-1]